MSNYEVRNENAEKYLRETGRVLRDALPEGMGFAPLVYDYGEGGNMFYISSGEREGMVKAMQEFLIKTKSHK